MVQAGVVAGVVVGLIAALGLGIIVGHFAVPKDEGTPGQHDLGDCTQGCESDVRPEDIPVVREYIDTCLDHACASVTCQPAYPAHYIAYHLGEDTITVDGVLDDQAWADTPRFTQFTNIYGPTFPGPTLETYAQLRYDNDFLYVAAYFEETDIWANQTDHNSAVWLDNCFEVFLDADLSTHWYKEFQINALETTWDLMLDKPYINGGTNLTWEMPGGEFKVFVDGDVNNPDSPRYNMKLKYRMENTGRVQYEVEVQDGEYWKTDAPANFWLMQPQYAYNIHLPERWGFLVFSEDPVNQTEHERFAEWNEYSVAVDTYNALKTYQALNGFYVDDVALLDLGPLAVSGQCVEPPEVTVVEDGFTASVRPLDQSHRTVTIRDDRYTAYSTEN